MELEKNISLMPAMSDVTTYRALTECWRESAVWFEQIEAINLYIDCAYIYRLGAKFCTLAYNTLRDGQLKRQLTRKAKLPRCPYRRFIYPWSPYDPLVIDVIPQNTLKKKGWRSFLTQEPIAFYSEEDQAWDQAKTVSPSESNVCRHRLRIFQLSSTSDFF